MTRCRHGDHQQDDKCQRHGHIASPCEGKPHEERKRDIGQRRVCLVIHREAEDNHKREKEKPEKLSGLPSQKNPFLPPLRKPQEEGGEDQDPQHITGPEEKRGERDSVRMDHPYHHQPECAEDGAHEGSPRRTCPHQDENITHPGHGVGKAECPHHEEPSDE